MGILRFLFHRKTFEFTPIPDDYPPDGTMQFMCREAPSYAHLPPSYLHYEFGPNCDESDSVAIDLSPKIIRKICQDKWVLAVVRSEEPHRYSKRKVPPLSFAELYHQVLQNAHPDISVYMETKLCLAYLTVGYDAFMLSAYQTFQNHTACFFDFYVFSKDRDMADAQTAFKLANAGQYDMKLEFIDHGPTSLEMNVNPNAIDIAFIQSIVEQTCKENGVQLINPPTPI